MTLLAFIAANPRCGFGELNEWRRTHRPDRSIDQLFAELDKRELENKITIHKTPNGDECEVKMR